MTEQPPEDTRRRHPAPGRPTIDVTPADGRWPPPWPNVAELATVLPTDRWTLVGGLMTQLHTIHRGIGVVRPTNDIDIVAHIETARGVPQATAIALESIGYQLQESIDHHNNTAHRFVRGTSRVDLVAGTGHDDIVDVLASDHPAPAVIEQLRGRDMVHIEGGTQALRRTINARLQITPDTSTTISVPRPFGALILKTAAYITDTRERDRHLYDAAALLACIEDPFTERDRYAGSDRARLMRLGRALPSEHRAWRQLPDEHRHEAQAALRILCALP